MESYVGEIRLFGGNFAPQGFLMCDGSLQSISNYEALFQLIGTTYGGDGQSTFGLPNLNGRVSVGAGTAATGTNYPIGSTGGAETVVLATGTIPSHTHVLQAQNAAGDTSVPTSGVALSGMGPAATVGTINTYAAASGTQVALAGNSVGNAGGGQPHSNIQPSLALRYIIATDGVYPTQA